MLDAAVFFLVFGGTIGVIFVLWSDGMAYTEGIHLYTITDKWGGTHDVVCEDGQPIPPVCLSEETQFSDRYYRDGGTVKCIKNERNEVIGHIVLDLSQGIVDNTQLPVRTEMTPSSRKKNKIERLVVAGGDGYGKA